MTIAVLALTVALAAVQQTPERIAEIRVHGNAATPDADIIKVAGIALGDVFPADGVTTIEDRLRKSGRFDTVEVRKRYRSIDGGEVALILLVHEVPGATASDPVPGAFKRLRRRTMFLPILDFAEGYGVAFGLLSSTKDLLGAGERLAVPFTWGGVRRIALEGERPFKAGPLTRVLGSVGLSQREHPRYEVDDRRVDVRARVERSLWQRVRLGAEAGHASVTFGGVDDSFLSYGADVTLDTRDDPGYTGSGVLATAGWRALRPDGRDTIDVGRANVRAFRRLFGQTVLAVRATYEGAGQPLPIYERLMLGGGSSVRGYRVGAFDGDQVFSTSAELRLPFTSRLTMAKTGFTIFIDAGAATEAGARLRDARFERGIGGGAFLIAPIFRLGLDVGWNRDGKARVHVSGGFTF